MIQELAIRLSEEISNIPRCNCEKVKEKYKIYTNRHVKWSDRRKRWGYIHPKKKYFRMDLDFPVGAFNFIELSQMLNLPYVAECQPGEKENFDHTGIYKRTCRDYDTIVFIVYPEDILKTDMLGKLPIIERIARETCI